MSAGFERIVEFYPAHDDFDPIKRTGSRSYMRIKFILRGPLGATQFMIGTTWGLPQSDESTARLIAGDAVSATKPTGYDVGYHSPAPQYDGQGDVECDLLPGGRCFYDGSGCRADEWVPGFIAGGSDWVWQQLEAEYNALFTDKATPPCERGSGAVSAVADKLREARALVKQLTEQNAKLRRCLLPVQMMFAQAECVDEPISDDAVVLHFMGSGASDQVTAGEVRAALATPLANAGVVL